MKKTKIVHTTLREKRHKILASVLPEVRKLVNKYDLAGVQAAVKVIYSERIAEKELKKAEEKVLALKRKLSN